MKVNIGIEISDDDRLHLARYMESDPGLKRLATRKMIREFVEGAVAFGVDRGASLFDDSESTNAPRSAADEPDFADSGVQRTGRLDMIDPEDQEVLAGKSAGFIRGWNAFKRRGRR